MSKDKCYRNRNRNKEKEKRQKEKNKTKGKEGKVQGKKNTERYLRRRGYIYSPNMLPCGQGLCSLFCASPTP